MNGLQRLAAAGHVCFRRRGLMLPIAVLLLLIPSPALADDPARVGLLGLLIALAGQLLRSATIGLAYIIRGGKNHRVYAEHLVTEGLYAHCRNPMYLGNFLLLAGLAVASNSVVFVLIGVPLALAMHRAIVAAEEEFLRGKFGAQYDDYCSRVPRWLPRLKGLAATIRGMQFDWRRVLAKEYQAPFDWLTAIAALILINLWRSGEIKAHGMLVAAMLLLVCVRLGSWLASRAIVRRTAPLEPRG